MYLRLVAWKLSIFSRISQQPEQPCPPCATDHICNTDALAECRSDWSAAAKNSSKFGVHRCTFVWYSNCPYRIAFTVLKMATLTPPSSSAVAAAAAVAVKLLPDAGWEEARPTGFLPLLGNWPAWPCICIVLQFCISPMYLYCICVDPADPVLESESISFLPSFFNSSLRPFSSSSSLLYCCYCTPYFQENQTKFQISSSSSLWSELESYIECLCAILSLEWRMLICIPRREVFAVLMKFQE